MPTLEFETTLNAPLQRVWEFHEDITTGLPAISPPEANVRLESADLPIKVGSRVVLSTKGPLGKQVRFAIKIVEHQPPRSVVFGEEARFVDVQERGSFKSWRHEHDFERMGETSTRMMDRITYRVPLGPIGWIVDLVFVRPKIRAMFRYRHQQLHRLLDGQT